MMSRLLNLIQDAIDFFSPPIDFGKFGVALLHSDGTIVPMDQADMDNLKADVEKSEAAFWLKKQAEAFTTHGPAILKMQ